MRMFLEGEFGCADLFQFLISSPPNEPPKKHLESYGDHLKTFRHMETIRGHVGTNRKHFRSIWDPCGAFVIPVGRSFAPPSCRNDLCPKVVRNQLHMGTLFVSLAESW
jgi:hypothetical protein